MDDATREIANQDPVQITESIWRLQQSTSNKILHRMDEKEEKHNAFTVPYFTYFDAHSNYDSIKPNRYSNF